MTMSYRRRQGLQLLTLLSLSYAFAYNECLPCDCCKGGAAYCRQSSYICNHGCIDGYFSSTCEHKCRNNCKTCSDKTKCDSCKDGYFNTFDRDGWTSFLCDYKCNSACVSCTLYSCDKCVDGKYNSIYRNCSEDCKSVCKSCTNGDSCTECLAGNYGSHCQLRCSERCENNQCDIYGRCKCKQNFTGYQCESCVKGMYGSSCNNSCPHGCSNNDCKINGDCYSCKTGFAGEKCGMPCPSGCDLSGCFMDGACKRCKEGFTGNNCSQCNGGYYGDKCDKCPYGCANNTCKNNGECISCKLEFVGRNCSSCKVGRYGSDCNNTCSTGCVDNFCQSDGGCQCKSGYDGFWCKYCVKGKYGPFCNNSCPLGCYNNFCDANGHCRSCNVGFTGKTCDQCNSGKYGTDCTKSCSYWCLSNKCERNGSCFPCKRNFMGNNCDQCIDGMYGIHCNQKCPATCNSCITATNCTSCKAGRWGNTCKACPTNCLNCSSDIDCSSCEHGFYGQTCSNICSSNCLENICNNLSGSCLKGCIAGNYGDICDKNCSSTCKNSKCGRQLGECLDGCKTGYTGEKCNLGHSEAADSVSRMAVALWAGVGSAAFVLIIALILIPVIIIRKRRQKGTRANEENNSKREKSTEIEVNDRNMSAANNHTDEKVGEVRESVTCSNNTNETEHDDVDVIYAKPIKPKRKFERAKSSEGSSFSAMDKKPGSDNENTDDINAALEIEEDIGTLSTRTKSVNLEENARRAAEPDSVDTYYNVGAVRKRKIKLDHLYELVIKKTVKGFTDEFQTLPAMLIKPYVFSQKPANISKNRYKGIYPYDDTRVVLNDGESDYINASYVDGYNQNKAYIASIGPTTRYMGDMSVFWIMVWQEKVGKIVMLTRLLEGEVAKCNKYWPDKDFTSTFADIQVTCVNEEEYSDYIFRTFSVQKDSVKRNIFHLHFTAWPDKGTPDDVTSLIEFRQKVNRTKTQHNGPLLVHCSAGIGRTGTYIALDSITKEGEAEGEVDIYACVRNMREQRVNMIQTAEQYEYLHNALVHTLTFDSDAIEACKFGDYMKKHTADHLGKMFEKLQASVEHRSAEEMEAVKRNRALKDKNIDGADIPGDRNRPKLNTQMTRGSSDYINAIYVNSFRTVNRFLIAQTPLPNTVEDFLTLIVQEKVSCVICMDHSTSGNKDIGIYCPVDNQTLNRGTFTVKCEPGNGTDLYLLRKIKISYSTKSGSEEVTIPHVQFTQWGSSHIAPEDPVKFVKFINEMELKFGGKDLKRPILVHCSTGASRSGLYCVLSILLEKIQINQEVSVVNTVRQIKYRRHMAIPNKDQYIFCHQCVNEYLNTFETYSNFSPVS